MRYALLALALFACSDSTEPEDHRIDAGTYTLELTGCRSCSLTSTPGLALTFRDGETYVLEVSGVTDTGATATITTPDRADATEMMEYSEVVENGPAYVARWDYGPGLLTIALRKDGSCEFALLYPNVDAGLTTCELL